MNKKNVLLAIVAVAVLSACGSSKNSSSKHSKKTDSTKITPDSKPVVAKTKADWEKQIKTLDAQIKTLEAQNDKTDEAIEEADEAIKKANKALVVLVEKDYNAAIAGVTAKTGSVTDATITVDGAAIDLVSLNASTPEGKVKDAAGTDIGEYHIFGYATNTNGKLDTTKPYAGAGIYASTDGNKVKAFIGGKDTSSEEQITAAATISGAPVLGRVPTKGIVYYVGKYVSYDASKAKDSRFKDSTDATKVALQANFKDKTIGIDYDSADYTQADQTGKIYANGMIEYRKTGSKGAYTGHGKFFSGENKYGAGDNNDKKAAVKYVTGSETEGKVTRAFTAEAK